MQHLHRPRGSQAMHLLTFSPAPTGGKAQESRVVCSRNQCARPGATIFLLLLFSSTVCNSSCYYSFFFNFNRLRCLSVSVGVGVSSIVVMKEIVASKSFTTTLSLSRSRSINIYIYYISLTSVLLLISNLSSSFALSISASIFSLLSTPFFFPYPNLIYLESNDSNIKTPNVIILVTPVRLCNYIIVVVMILVVAVTRKERGRERGRGDEGEVIFRIVGG